jgi:hypothetical protein
VKKIYHKNGLNSHFLSVTGITEGLDGFRGQLMVLSGFPENSKSGLIYVFAHRPRRSCEHTDVAR